MPVSVTSDVSRWPLPAVRREQAGEGVVAIFDWPPASPVYYQERHRYDALQSDYMTLINRATGDYTSTECNVDYAAWATLVELLEARKRSEELDRLLTVAYKNLRTWDRRVGPDPVIVAEFKTQRGLFATALGGRVADAASPCRTRMIPSAHRPPQRLRFHQLRVTQGAVPAFDRRALGFERQAHYWGSPIGREPRATPASPSATSPSGASKTTRLSRTSTSGPRRACGRPVFHLRCDGRSSRHQAPDRLMGTSVRNRRTGHWWRNLGDSANDAALHTGRLTRPWTKHRHHGRSKFRSVNVGPTLCWRQAGGDAGAHDTGRMERRQDRAGCMTASPRTSAYGADWQRGLARQRAGAAP
jgi:hypothetical protein